MAAVSFQGFKSLIENSPDAVSLIDTQGEILYGSASTSRMFGYQPEELLGRNCLEFIHPEDRDDASKAIRDVLATPRCPGRWEARVRCKDGNYSWVENTVSNLLFEREVQAIVIHQRDVNAHKAAEAVRQQHAEQLASSNLRLEEFAYTAAHDLREPLRVISIYTEMLLKTAQLDAKATEMARLVVKGTERISALVDDLLSFANTGTPELPQCVDLRQAVAQAMLNLAPAIEASDAVLTVGSLPVIRGSESQLVRLFQNLISNALKYRGEDAVRVNVTAERQKRGWVVKVEDNGIGIEPKNQSRVFLPFVRLVTQEVPGTGLGLAVSKRIVEALGGTIWIESEAGGGSTFCFTIGAEAELPAHEA